MYIFSLDEQTVSAIFKALAEQPYKVSAPVIHELQKQVNEQQSDGG